MLKVYDHIQQSFPSEKSPAVGRHPGRRRHGSPHVQAGIAELERQALATGKVLGPIAQPGDQP